MAVHRPEPASNRRAPDSKSVAALLRTEQRLLVASAISAGLWRLRPRSAPTRLALEGRRFVRLLALWVEGGSSAARNRAARDEIRLGALAVASPQQVSEIVALWRRVIAAFLASADPALVAPPLSSALDGLEGVLARGAAAAGEDRIDVLVVGASAGGLGAIIRLLEGLDASPPATVLVVLHLSPHSPGLVPALLGRHSELTVVAAVDGAALHLGHVYVAPPGRCHLVAAPDAMHLVEGPPVHFVRPSADLLFESAAAAFGSHLVSVVLSGTGADGAAGTRAVHDHGGVTLVQSPKTAEFAGMPESSIATGTVDRVVPLERLGDLIARLGREGRRATLQ